MLGDTKVPQELLLLTALEKDQNSFVFVCLTCVKLIWPLLFPIRTWSLRPEQ